MRLPRGNSQPRAPRRTPTLVIFPPLKLAKRLSERVRTLDALWTVKRLLAGTFLLHLRGRGGGCQLASWGLSSYHGTATPGRLKRHVCLLRPQPPQGTTDIPRLGAEVHEQEPPANAAAENQGGQRGGGTAQ